MLGILTQVDKTLAAKVADGLGMPVPKKPIYPINHSVPADGIQKNYEPIKMKQSIEKSEALSMANTIKNSIKTRCIAILAANGVDENSLAAIKNALEVEGATTKIIAPKLGTIKGAARKEIKVDQSFLNTSSVLFDAVYIPSGAKSATALIAEPDAIHFVNEAYKHCKAIAANGDGVTLLNKSYAANKPKDAGLIIDKPAKDFVKAIAQHRFWEREKERKVPA